MFGKIKKLSRYLGSFLFFPEGERSAQVMLKTLLATPTVTAKSTINQITLCWTAIAGATAYEGEVNGTVVSNGTN